MMKKKLVLAMLLLLLFGLCGCKQNPTEEQLFAKLIAHFENRGFQVELTRLADTQPDREVPIYKASAWHRLMVGKEEVLVYFDESNRADYLSASVDESVFGHTARFGLRFVVVYNGQDAEIIAALESMPQ